MAKQSDFMAALKRHKRWADAASVVSIVLMVGLLSLTAYLADIAETSETSRIGMYIAMVGVVIVACIWQAAGFIAASIESALRRGDDRGPSE